MSEKEFTNGVIEATIQSLMESTQHLVLESIHQLLNENGFIPALTIHQPWASLLACGAKLYETRGWATKYRGWVLIHAGMKNVTKTVIKMRDDGQQETLNAMYTAIKPAVPPDRTTIHHVPHGSIIAIAELVGCHRIQIDPKTHRIALFDSSGNQCSVSLCTNELLFGDFTPRRFAWEFRNMTMLSEPIPAKGKQRLWKWEWLNK